MLRGFFGNLIFAIIARMLCGNHLNCLKVIVSMRDYTEVEVCLFPLSDAMPSSVLELIVLLFYTLCL